MLQKNILPSPAELLPHRGRALVLDAILELEPGMARGLWTPEEGYFVGHFPDNPVLPGHWTMESVALIAACALTRQEPGITPMFREVNGKFLGMIKPGDVITLEATFADGSITKRGRMGIAQGVGRATVGGKAVYTAELMKAIWEIKDEQ